MAWPSSRIASPPDTLTTLPELRARPVTELPGCGPGIAAALERLGIESLADLISHYPSRHEDLSNVKRISRLRLGERATVVGRVVSVRGVGRPVRGRTPGFKVQLYDGSGYIPAVVWGREWLRGQLVPETWVVVSGEVQRRYGIQIAARTLEIVDDPGSFGDGAHTGKFVPIYPAGRGITPRRLRALIHRALDAAGYIPDPLPVSVLESRRLPNLHDAIREVHFPESRDRLQRAMRRLVFHELFLVQIGLAARKMHLERSEPGRSNRGDGSLVNRYLNGLPFALTGAQERVVEEVLADMSSERPMRRLVQGDVGSGKTAVAICALLTAIEAGRQGAIMAPTEVLAEQHYLSVSNALEELPVEVVLLTGSQTAAERRVCLNAIENGQAHLIIGTHALIQRHVRFRDLSLVVVDEQHRFGVSQRAVFKEKGISPDTLIMTATPIPRTLSLTLYGDLEVSVIDELPPGRKPVETVHVESARRMEAYAAVEEELDEGRQAYVICPLVEESEALEEVRAAEELYGELSEKVFPHRRVGLLHGRMSAAEKREVMAAFRGGGIEVLVATVVVEVGVDVPNASIIVIEGAERFGLSQLHQLRGRVCRGEHPPRCFLVGDPQTEDSRARLDAMIRYQDGFRLSEADLAIRGEGTLFGSRQSGMPDLKVAKLLRDVEVLVEARKEAFALVANDPYLRDPAHGPLKREVEELLGADIEWLFRE
ncbi:ATP-dependent DNA helicase RecG [Rubrobacter taiwanensis]|uniref:ATP-dependent DNA helicase RecG n=1 Tax=Rubrobacter taiwanensis TaxID=185139 RepID=A0A4V2NWA6_9ACTN|nr:ATP-dependent DNA helicase RecG [Rubrobacter taiwanensis]TCJ16662.1 ATP-dependent DNA helicase RecG [Rubrobacter taiwanensis]